MLLAVFAICALLSSVNGQSTGLVAFSASLDEGGKPLVINQIVKFPNAFTNFGDAYDSNTGIFTAKKTGVYVFFIHTISHGASGFWLRLYHNDTPRASTHGSSPNAWTMGGNSVILRVKVGERVYVKAIAASNIYGDPDNVYSIFSGHIIGQ